jgi:hypothetical protein
MPPTKGSQAPSSVAEGMNGIVSAIAATLTAPDAGPHIAFLQQLLQAAVGQIQKANQPQGQGGPPGGAPPGGPPGAGGPPGGGPPQGGGTNIGQLMGGGGGPPAGPSGPSQSGASSEDIRRMVGAQAGTPG